MSTTDTASTAAAWRGLAIPDIAGQAVLVTGGSGGIGRAVAIGFAAVGAKVIVQFFAGEAAAESVAEEIAAAGGEAALVRFDASDNEAVAEGVREAIAVHGRLDGLINNAGSMLGRAPFETAETEHLDYVFAVNARSVVVASRVALPALKASRGYIINTTSIAARNGGSTGASIYGAAKGFVATATRGMAKEFAGYGIRVNAVAPGVILTPFHERDSTQAQLDAALTGIPLGRLGIPDECVGAYLYLASPMLSGYVTGQSIEVNGGQLM
ncbi:MAG TPA: SDR family NAD(P)-dependent oxidoreductase, partial [Methylomirabilota bacterium]|nr:SDR family NAD(P)-dependent oxidoreductase [Methylomirabilota bacterium]